MQLTAHFRLEEFSCKDGTEVPPHLLGNVKALALCLERVREKFGRPINIISGYRTVAYNAKCGGKKPEYDNNGFLVAGTGSKHLYAMAADIVINGVETKEVAEEIEAMIEAGEIPEGGVGVSATFVHYDHRLKKARWKG